MSDFQQDSALTELYGPLPPGIIRARDFSASTFQSKAVSLVDLLRARMAQGQPVIRGVVFENCRLEGPGVVLDLGSKYHQCDFGNPGDDIRSLILRPASETSVVGAIPFDGCIFANCQFAGVGFTGQPHFLDQLLAVGHPQ